MTGRIMIVDGVPTNRIVMKVRLTAISHQVTPLASGREALTLLQTDRPRIIIIGTTLPDQRPADLCRQIRAMARVATVPILVLAETSERLALLHAGATAVIDPAEDDQMLFARIRALLRQTSDVLGFPGSLSPIDEPVTEVVGPPRIALVANSPQTAMSWRFALQDRLNYDITICEQERALAEGDNGPAPDLYVIDCDIHKVADGLRLLSELRSRRHSRNSVYIMALSPEREDMSTVALDLGAGDVLSRNFGSADLIEEAAIRIETQILLKQKADIQRSEIRRNQALAMIDPLTKLHNRRYALPQLEEMLADLHKRPDMLAILVMDLDRFKAVNDHFGHAAGDQVLVEFANRAQCVLPKDALLARVGGEEFLAAFYVQTSAEATDISEHLRLALATRQVVLKTETGPVDLPLTVSLGLALFDRTTRTKSAEQAMDRADQALLSAKALGRNRLIMAEYELAA